MHWLPSTSISRDTSHTLNNTFLGCVRSPLHHHQGERLEKRATSAEVPAVCPTSSPRPSVGSALPLPLITDAAACLSFLFDSLDDAVEDAAKFLMLAALALGSYAVVALVAQVCACCSAQLWLCCCCHPLRDMLADRLGDAMNPVQNAIRRGFGYNEKVPRPDRGDPVAKFGYAATIIDDLVEDTFKAMCISSHVLVGGILRTAVLTRAAETNIGSTLRGGDLIARTAGAVVAVGTPVSVPKL